MTRQEYIQLRRSNEVYPILWEYFKEKTNSNMGYNQFVQLLNVWIDTIFQQSLKNMQPLSKSQLMNDIAELVIKHYDEHFTIVIMTIETEVKKKVIHQYIL